MSVRIPTTKKGWMKKQSRKGMIQNWKTRYFVLHMGKITYYVNKSDTEPFGTDQKGEMPLNSTEVVENFAKSNDCQIYIQAFNGENNMLMEAESAADCKEWKACFKEHCRYADAHAEDLAQLDIAKRRGSAISTTSSERRGSAVVSGTPVPPASDRRASSASLTTPTAVESEKSPSKAPSSDASLNSTRTLPPTPITASASEQQTATPPVGTKRISVTVPVPVPLPVATPPVVAPVTTDNSRESVSIPVPVPLSAAALKRASTAIDVNTDGPAISPLDLSAQLSDGLALLMATLAETNKRNQFIKDLAETVQLVFKSVVKNVQEGELGKRGEEWFVLVFLFVFIVVVGVGAYLHYLVTSLIWLSSFVYILVGVALMICSLWELKANATPFIYPTKDNTLVSRGVYALVRHPMYGGLVLFCIGRSILANSMVKLLLSVVLAFVLDIVSQIEESLLNKQHPKKYKDYTRSKKKLIPFLY